MANDDCVSPSGGETRCQVVPSVDRSRTAWTLDGDGHAHWKCNVVGVALAERAGGAGVGMENAMRHGPLGSDAIPSTVRLDNQRRTGPVCGACGSTRAVQPRASCSSVDRAMIDGASTEPS